MSSRLLSLCDPEMRFLFFLFFPITVCEYNDFPLSLSEVEQFIIKCFISTEKCAVCVCACACVQPSIRCTVRGARR